MVLLLLSHTYFHNSKVVKIYLCSSYLLMFDKLYVDNQDRAVFTLKVYLREFCMKFVKCLVDLIYFYINCDCSFSFSNWVVTY